MYSLAVVIGKSIFGTNNNIVKGHAKSVLSIVDFSDYDFYMTKPVEHTLFNYYTDILSFTPTLFLTYVRKRPYLSYHILLLL